MKMMTHPRVALAALAVALLAGAITIGFAQSSTAKSNNGDSAQVKHKLIANKTGVAGVLLGGGNKCTVGRKVVLSKIRSGKNKRLGSATSDNQRLWAVDAKLKRHTKYKVVAKPGKCAKSVFKFNVPYPKRHPGTISVPGTATPGQKFKIKARDWPKQAKLYCDHLAQLAPRGLSEDQQAGQRQRDNQVPDQAGRPWKPAPLDEGRATGEGHGRVRDQPRGPGSRAREDLHRPLAVATTREDRRRDRTTAPHQRRRRHGPRRATGCA